MKKLVKMVGLLLIAGALLAGCKKDADSNAADIETTEIKLSDGTWESEELITGESTSGGGSSSIKVEDKSTFDVSGETVTLKSNWNSMTMKTTYPDSTPDDTIASVKSFYEMICAFATFGGKTASVNLEGKTLTFSMEGEANASELEEMNAEMGSTSEYQTQFPANVKILTNEKKTIYKISWSQDYNDDTMNIDSFPCTCTMTIKKK